DTGYVDLDGKKTKISCFYKQYVFSAHAGQQGLQWMIKTVKPKVLIINHGEERSCTALAEFAKSYCGKIYAANLGDIIKV
ncbi:MAG: MBL fold metallo-hydrolase RNA specificity domain-containing protein, partial [archaeon]